MQILPFHVEHLRRMPLQAQQAWCAPMLTEDLLNAIDGDCAYTALIDEAPIAVAGLMQFWSGRAMAWAFLSPEASRHLTPITRAVLRFLEVRAPRRVEAYVDADFNPGHRWMRLLGFHAEGYLRAFKPDGGDQVLYARIRHG